MSYHQQDFSEQVFTITFTYNFIDIMWELTDTSPHESKSIFDVPIVPVNDRYIDPRMLPKIREEELPYVNQNISDVDLERQVIEPHNSQKENINIPNHIVKDDNSTKHKILRKPWID